MVMESYRPCDIAELLSFAEIVLTLNFAQSKGIEAVYLCLSCETIMDAERQTNHFLCNNHERSCDVN